MTQVGFLRAVNVGKRTVAMARLKAVVENVGYDDVWTYINSGNVVFTGSGRRTALEDRLEAAFEPAFGFAVETFGGLHVLYNNAGILPPDDAGTVATPDDTWDRVMAVNLKGVWLGCKHGIPALLESGGGAIVNVSSLVALMGSAVPQIAYTASKGGVLAMTRELAVEYSRRGIRANTLCPGPIDTPLMAELMADPQWAARRLVHIPMGRPGQAAEIAKAALFLASDESSFMTGATLVVDGGITAAYVTPE